MARQKNNQPLPPIKQFSGPRIPPDRYWWVLVFKNFISYFQVYTLEFDIFEIQSNHLFWSCLGLHIQHWINYRPDQIWPFCMVFIVVRFWINLHYREISCHFIVFSKKWFYTGLIVKVRESIISSLLQYTKQTLSGHSIVVPFLLTHTKINTLIYRMTVSARVICQEKSNFMSVRTSAYWPWSKNQYY